MHKQRALCEFLAITQEQCGLFNGSSKFRVILILPLIFFLSFPKSTYLLGPFLKKQTVLFYAFFLLVFFRTPATHKDFYMQMFSLENACVPVGH